METSLLQARVERHQASIGSRSIGRIIQTEFGMYYVDVAKNPFIKNQRVFLFINDKGEIEPVFEGTLWKNKYMIKAEMEGMPPSRNLWDFNAFIDTPLLKLDEAYNLAKEVLEDTVVFRDKRLYDLVVAWCMYTWLRGLFPKNINLYFIGFPATGKSQALRYCKHFARYVIDYDPTAEKSYKWNISHTLGVIAIDEAEYISKIQASKLRKFHEAGVFETRLIGLPIVGLTPIDLRVDAPLVLSATHPPSDTAFLQRGYIIRMIKGSPKIKDFDLIPDLEYRKYALAKSVLCNWSKIFETLSRVYYQLSFKNIDERIKDLTIPIATILEALGKEWDWVLEYAKYSFSQANFVTPETTAFIQSLSIVKSEAMVKHDKYILPVSKVSKIIEETARILGASPSKLDYLRQYLFAGCEIGMMNNELCYICDRATVDALLENISIVDVHGYSFDKELKEQLDKASKLVRCVLKAIALYIKENNLDYKNGVVQESITRIKEYIKNTSYMKKTYKDFKHKVKRSLIDGGTPRWIRDMGVDFTIEGDEIKVTIDLDRIRDKLDLLASIEW